MVGQVCCSLVLVLELGFPQQALQHGTWPAEPQLVEWYVCCRSLAAPCPLPESCCAVNPASAAALIGPGCALQPLQASTLPICSATACSAGTPEEAAELQALHARICAAKEAAQAWAEQVESPAADAVLPLDQAQLAKVRFHGTETSSELSWHSWALGRRVGRLVAPAAQPELAQA